MRPRIRRRLGFLSLAAGLGLAACSAGGDAGPDITLTDQVAESVPSVRHLTTEASGVWGRGRAVRSIGVDGGGFGVVTTTGVYYVSSVDSEPVQLAQFDSPVQSGPIAWMSDPSTLAISTTQPSALRTFDLSTGQSTMEVALPIDASVRSLDVVPSGAVLLDTTTGPWTIADGAIEPTPMSSAPTSGASAVLPNGIVVSPMAESPDIEIIGIEGPQRRTLELPQGATVRDVQTSPNGSVVGVTVDVVGEDQIPKDVIHVLDGASFDPISSIDPGRRLESFEWALTDTAVVVGGDASPHAWTFDGSSIPTTAPVDSQVFWLLPYPGGLLSAHVDGAIVRWSAAMGDPAVLKPGGTVLRDVQVSADGSTVTTVDYYGSIETLRLADGMPLASDDRFAPGELTGVAVSVDGTRVGVSSSTGEVAMLDDTLADQWMFRASDAPAFVGAVSFDPASGAIATGLAQRTGESAFNDMVTVWDEEQHVARYSVGGERENVTGCSFFYSRIRFSNDATTMATASHDFSVQIVDLATGQVLHTLPGTTTILDLAFSPDDDLLVATYDNGTVSVWQTTDYSLAASYQGAPGGYFAIAVMPDSATMAASDVTGSIMLVDLMTGQPLRVFQDTGVQSSTLTMTPDGALVAAPIANGGIGIWSTGDGARIATLSGHTDQVTGLAFAPSGDWLASSSLDGTARTWDVTRLG
jgi:WD40 repeat protein